MEWVKRGLTRWFKRERNDSRADLSRNPVAHAADDRPPPRVESSVGRVVIMDLRTEEEQQLQAAVQAGAPLGADLDARAKELLEIAASRELLRDERVVAIGRELDHEGGKELMQAVYDRLSGWSGPPHAQHPSLTWDGIGDWRY